MASKMHEEDEKGKARESDWGQIKGIECQAKTFHSIARSRARCKGTPSVFEQKTDMVRCGL